MGSWRWLRKPVPAGAMQGAMTDELVEVIGVSCKLLLSDDVSVGRVSSNGSIPDLVGKQNLMKRDFRIYGQFMHYCLGVQLGLRNLIQIAYETDRFQFP